MNKILRVLFPIILSFLSLAALFYLLRSPNQSARAEPQADLLVTTLDDVVTPDAFCSLREALDAANTNTTVPECGTGAVLTDTITFNVAGAITLTSQLSVIAGGPLIIDGASAISIDGNNIVRILNVDAGGELEVKNLLLSHGRAANGAGIHNAGYLTINHTNLLGNSGDFGGGIYNTADLLIVDSTLQGNVSWGYYTSGGGIYNAGNLDIISSTLIGNVSFYNVGGGIYNNGILTIHDSLISGSSAYHDGGAIYNDQGIVTITHSTISGGSVNYKGGGILNYSGVMSIADSTLTGANALYGGAIYNQYGIMSLENNTFYDNHASYDGGAIYNDHSTTMTITNSTISDNSAGWWGGGIRSVIGGGLTINNTTITANAADLGGGIYGEGMASNSIFANSLSGGDCSEFFGDGGHNISSDDSCYFDPANGSLPNTDPLLGPLQDNGGPTLTHALLPNSPAIDAGDDTQCPPTDQRGITRPQDGNGDGSPVCDIGAYELEFGHLLVTTLDDLVTPDAFCSLREALDAANTNTTVPECGMGTVLTDTITFNVAGTIYLSSQLEVEGGGPLVIDGDGAITTSGGAATRVWSVEEASILTLRHLVVSDGYVYFDFGAGLNNDGNVSIIDCHFSNNHADTFYGGGIYNSGNITITGTTISANSSGNGGGFYNDFDGTFTIFNSAFTGNQTNGSGGGLYNYNSSFTPTLSSLILFENQANSGGAIYNQGTITVTNSIIYNNIAGTGGGIYNQNGRLTVIESTIHANDVGYNGGGILNVSYNRDGAFNTGFTTTIINSTLSNNSAELGGGIRSDMSPLVIQNSTLSGNSASIGGGGVSSNVGTLAILNSTLSGNSAQYGGNIYIYGDTVITNTILANSPSGDDCGIVGGTLTDGGHNLSSDDSCGFDPANGSLPNTDPLLGSLQDNGGSTLTHALLENSPAIDAGDDAQCLPTDQRGVPRPLDGDLDGEAMCDIGSFELEAFPQAPLQVTISAPNEGLTWQVIPFTATVEPISTTLPVTYVWEASGHPPITETMGLTDTVGWQWEVAGTYGITVTATNLAGAVTDTHQITLVAAINRSYLPVIEK